MKKTEAINTIKAMPGMYAKATGYGTEIAVYPKGKADQAYFTDDPQDAVDTAKGIQLGYSAKGWE